jgi:leucine-zipper of insertion element IS481/Phosphatidylethanolamine-binding protein
MKLHGNARTCLHSRLLIVARVLEQRWTIAAAAEAAGVSERTPAKWLARYRDEGRNGLRDRSSAPRRIARRTGEPAPYEGQNEFGTTGYRGPCPPPGRGRHRYVFRLYALDAEPALPTGAAKAELEQAIQGHVADDRRARGHVRARLAERIAPAPHGYKPYSNRWR